MGIIATITRALGRKGRPNMPSLPLSYFVTGNAQVVKGEAGLTVTYPIQINDADGRKVCDDELVVSVPADTLKAAEPDPEATKALQDLAVLSANAAAKAKLEALVATKTTAAALGDSTVLERITG